MSLSSAINGAIRNIAQLLIGQSGSNRDLSGVYAGEGGFSGWYLVDIAGENILIRLHIRIVALPIVGHLISLTIFFVVVNPEAKLFLSQ